MDTCFDGDEFSVGREVGHVFEWGGSDEADFTAGFAVVGEGGCDLGLPKIDGGVFG
jgi:hypothetical protein